MTDTRISAVELSRLLARNWPVEPEPCRVCGHPEMTVASMGSGQATVYVCELAQINVTRSGMPRADRDDAAKHYADSRQSITYHGDPEVVAVLLELRALREAAGDDMTVPVGTVAYPYGHGKNRCWYTQVHRGGDRWEEQHDRQFTHDPSHAGPNGARDAVET